MPDDATLRRAEEVLRAVSLGDWTVLVGDVAADLEEVYALGLAEGLHLTDAGISLDQANERAVAWARERAATLVTMIEENTRDMIRGEVATAIEEGWSANQLAGELVDSAGFGADRAETIARTEIIAGNNAGLLQGFKDARDSGVVVMKEWITAGDDLVSEECQENEDEGPIELDEDFPSGATAPPEHPRCRCSLTPYLVPEDRADSGDEA